tara:strand:- start:174 stop:1241 length:1068 start_codon:yes stop_codon:yes gene_type:complete
MEEKNNVLSEDIKFDFDDILIEPTKQSDIITRKEINIKYGLHLPLIAAPMDTVVSKKNVNKFTKKNINVCMPRGENIEGIDIGANMVFISYSLIEFTELFISKKADKYPSHVLIDIANGHMSDLVYVTKKAKEYYGKSMQLMVGNIANPKTYKILSEAGADFIRVGIGNGNACSTTVHTGIGYPLASLIEECYKVSLTLKKEKRAKIVADGGMKNYSDIIKALALGSDYVMIGSLFNKAIESCGMNYKDTWYKSKKEISQKKAENLHKKGKTVYKKFRGMSTKEVQKKWGNKNLKTSEGVIRFRPVEYTLEGWIENFDHYLRSAMSYTNFKEIEDFVGGPQINKISYQSYERYNK